MKTLILSIACVFTLNKLIAQQSSLAFLDSKIVESKKLQINDYEHRSLSLNSNYLEKRKTKEPSNIVTNWKNRLVNFDLKNSSVFNHSEKSTYQIIFKNKQVYIIAVYNDDNEILSTNETYRNIKLPFEVMEKISKEYPNYSFGKNIYHIKYDYKTGIDEHFYRVQIVNGNHKKTIKLDKTLKTI